MEAHPMLSSVLKMAVTKEFANTMAIEYMKRLGGIQECSKGFNLSPWEDITAFNWDGKTDIEQVQEEKDNAQICVCFVWDA